MKGSSTLRAGEWVEVRTREEILATLDGQGCLDGMPFMPEMLAFCGRRFRVFKRAHKTCDTVNKTGGRRVASAVHLDELRCDGAAHGGCQAGCLLFWKDAWVKPLPQAAEELAAPNVPAAPPPAFSPTELPKPGVRAADLDLHQATRQVGADGAVRYRCQATQLPVATSALSGWDVRQY